MSSKSGSAQSPILLFLGCPPHGQKTRFVLTPQNTHTVPPISQAVQLFPLFILKTSQIQPNSHCLIWDTVADSEPFSRSPYCGPADGISLLETYIGFLVTSGKVKLLNTPYRISKAPLVLAPGYFYDFSHQSPPLSY